MSTYNINGNNIGQRNLFFCTPFNLVSFRWKASQPLLELFERQTSFILKFNMISLSDDDILILCAMIFWICVLFCCLGPCLMATNSIKNKWTRSNRRLIHHIDETSSNRLAPQHPRRYPNLSSIPETTSWPR